MVQGAFSVLPCDAFKILGDVDWFYSHFKKTESH